VPPAGPGGEPEADLRRLWESTRPEYLALFGQFQFHTGLERLFAFIRSINAYVEKRAPWKLGKSAEPADKALLATALATIAEALRLAATALRPVIPGASAKIGAVLGYEERGPWLDELAWGGSLEGRGVAASLVLFPRPQPAADKAP
jgi:methionyl-tRNA synthetase